MVAVLTVCVEMTCDASLSPMQLACDVTRVSIEDCRQDHKDRDDHDDCKDFVGQADVDWDNGNRDCSDLVAGSSFPCSHVQHHYIIRQMRIMT